METRQLEPNTRRLAVGVLRRVLDGAVVDGLLGREPRDRVGAPPQMVPPRAKRQRTEFR